MNNLRQQWEARYERGDTPWNSGQTPPEVSTLLASGRVPSKTLAIDLGCGTAANVVTMARWGLNTIGVELSEQALDQARQRIDDVETSIQRRVALVQGDVAHLPLTGFNASYILDIGCLHGVPPSHRPSYAAGVVSNLTPGGYYHLFAFDLPEDPSQRGENMPWRGLVDGEVEGLFSPALAVVEVVHGDPDHAPCRWYLLRKR